MQKLLVKLKNTPKDAPQVLCSVNSELNKEETLSVQDIVLTNNNPEVDQSQYTGRPLKPLVYIISKDGQILMPCSCAKARRMLKKGAAKVVKRIPFTIQLNFECDCHVQEVVLGIDTGYGNIGFSAISKKSELISGTLKLDGRTKERLEDRKMYRRNKRSKLWHREPRWKNRISTKKKGWLPPSVKRRYDTHINIVNKISGLLPISKVIIEVAKFDIQKLENPNISGKEYQQGTMYDYQNMTSYLKATQKNKCPFCKKEFNSGESKAIHHRHKKGDSKRTNRPQGLLLLHKKCHIKLHKEGKENKFQNVKVNQYKESTFMSIINKRFWTDISNLEVTYGNITFVNRNSLGLNKTHYNDAFVIADGNNQVRTCPFEIIQKRKNNRCLQLNRKGFKPSIRRKRYKFQPKDIVKVKNKAFQVKGIHSYGTQIKLINKNGIVTNKSVKKLDEYLFHQKTLIWR